MFRSFIRAYHTHPLKSLIDNELDNRTLTGMDNVRNFVRIQVKENENDEGQNGDLKVRKLLKARKVQKFANTNINFNNQDNGNNGQNNNDIG